MKFAPVLAILCILFVFRWQTMLSFEGNYLRKNIKLVILDNNWISSPPSKGKPTKVLKDIDDIIPIDLELGESIKSGATSIVESVTTESTPETDSILDEESRETGTINTSVYTSYIRAIGFFLFLCIIISIVIMQASRNMTDWWLSYWVSNANNNSTTNFTDGLPDKPFLSVSNPYFSLHYTMQHYMLIYLLLALANTLFTLFRAFLFAFGGLTAASCIHKSLLKVIMAVNMNVIYDSMFVKSRIFSRKLRSSIYRRLGG